MHPRAATPAATLPIRILDVALVKLCDFSTPLPDAIRVAVGALGPNKQGPVIDGASGAGGKSIAVTNSMLVVLGL